MVWPGEEKAWDILLDLDAKDVTTNAKALFNSYDSTYALTCFGQDICVSLKDRIIFSKSRLGALLVTSLGDYSRLSILRYLIHAIDLPLSLVSWYALLIYRVVISLQKAPISFHWIKQLRIFQIMIMSF